MMLRHCTQIAVIGAGIIGLATALELAQRGDQVTLIDHRHGDRHGQATAAAGAMLTVFSEVSAREAHDTPDRVAVETRERLAARRAYPEWLASIQDLSGRTVSLIPGVWVIGNAAGEDDTAELAAIRRTAEAHHARVEAADPNQIPGLAPQATLPTFAGILLHDEASVDTADLLAALTAAADRHPHLTWVDTQAAAVSDDGHDLTIQLAAGSTQTAERVVLAAGAQLPRLLEHSRLGALGIPPIIAGRGVSLTLRPPFSLPQAIRTPNRGFACGTHLVPRTGTQVYLGATNRLSTTPEPDRPATLDELETLITGGTRELHTGLRDAEILQLHVGHRPLTADHLPLVGQTANPRVLIASATYRTGVLLAPHIARLVADTLADPTAHADHPFAPQRPTPTPSTSQLQQWLASGSARSLVAMLRQPGGPLIAGRETTLETLITAAVTTAIQPPAQPDDRAVRLLQRAPVEECLPLLLNLLGRSA